MDYKKETEYFGCPCKNDCVAQTTIPINEQALLQTIPKSMETLQGLGKTLGTESHPCVFLDAKHSAFPVDNLTYDYWPVYTNSYKK